MVYITEEDVLSVIQDAMSKASIEKQPEIQEMLEQQVIDEVKSYIGGRFDVDKIFADPPIKNGMLIRIITCLTVYRAIRRNAARKVPEDYVEMNGWAYDALTRISDGNMPLPGLPETVDPETGKPISFWGTNRKPEYFL